MSTAKKIEARPEGPAPSAGRGHVGRAAAGAFDRRVSAEALSSWRGSVEKGPRRANAYERYLSEDAGDRLQTLEELKTLVQAVRYGVTDPWRLTDLIFYARHPELVGVPLTNENQESLDEWNAISALLVQPTLEEVGRLEGAGGGFGAAPTVGFVEGDAVTLTGAGRLHGGRAAEFDDIIQRSVQWCPGLSPALLKSLLAQESNFNPTVINQYGYAGIAQFGREAAREVGLNVGVAGSSSDERLNPSKAIPAAAQLLNLKAQRLDELAFSRYGRPEGEEFWKFVLAAYNGGEGTVSLAMGHAYRQGLAEARARGLVGVEAVSYARAHASEWKNVVGRGSDSPLGLAVARYFPALASAKYHEISRYPTQIIERVTS